MPGGRKTALSRRALTQAVAAGLAVVLLVITSCSLDDRELSRGTLAEHNDHGGSGSGNGAGGRDSIDDAGKDASFSGQSATGTGGGSLGGGGASTGNSGGASAAGADAAGSTGAPFTSRCGDVDRDHVDDCAETLAQNAGFDTDIGDWSAGAQLAAVWDARDAFGAAGSGSLLLSNLAPAASIPGAVMVAVEQCVSVVGGSSYELGARVLIPADQGAGEAGINVWLFSADGCVGAFLGAETPTTVASVDAWTALEGEVTVPLQARSMIVRLAASKPFVVPRFEALFDDVLVREK